MEKLATEILIVGGGLGGCAAALAAAESGRKVVMTEESDWIGGQLTSQATPPDEHGWIEHFGCTRSYRKMRSGVREYYRANYPLTKNARAEPFLNPGNGWVSPLCAEPIVYLNVLQQMLSAYTAAGTVKVLTEHTPTAAAVPHDMVTSVQFANLRTAGSVSISASFVIDATELGELLPLVGAEFESGSESRTETGEPSAAATSDPTNTQAFSMCFAMSHDENGSHTIDKPERYDFWRRFVPQLTPPWSGPLLSLTGINPRTMSPVTYSFAPHRESGTAFSGLWTYRRILDRDNFVSGAFASDITLVNYPQIDYSLKDLCSATSFERKQALINEARQLSLSFLYWLQTDGGFPGLKLRPDVMGTLDGLAKMPYIRESRRIKSEFTILEQYVSAKCRPGERFAERFKDTVGIGFYRIDLHPTVGGNNYLDIEALPFQLPLGALIPVRINNLLAGCKNIGTTHITNGCYRLHPVEWNIGEAAGSLAAFCLEKKMSPRDVRNTATKLREFQQDLVHRGVELDWPEDIDLNEGDPHRHAL